MDPTHIALLRDGFDAYLSALETSLEPYDHYLPYEFPYVSMAQWRAFADAMIQDELREATNRLHEWHDMLRSWHAWNGVVAKHTESAAWDLRREFMEPLMHYCLSKPSAFRDLMTFVGTNSLHQVRLSSEPGYKDVMEGDPTPAEPNPRELTRRKKEKRLLVLAGPLTGSDKFWESLRRLDDADYRIATKDYRNTNSHAIGPRIALGITKMVTRQVLPATTMEPLPSGGSRVVVVPGKFSPTYTFGGLEPLDLEATRKANLAQYRAARECFGHLIAMVRLHADKLPRADTPPVGPASTPTLKHQIR